MMYGGFYGSTFDLDRDGELNDFESFLDFFSKLGFSKHRRWSIDYMRCV